MRSFLLIGFVALVACSSSPDDAASSDDPIMGGVDATSTKLDAVGSILNFDATGNINGLCTGTLIAPDLVLTAKHCVYTDPSGTPSSWKRIIDEGKVTFRIGFRTKTAREIATKELYTCGLDTGGSAFMGCDVAIYRLAEAVTDVTPIAVATASMPSSLVGTKATVLGFGGQSNAGNVVGTRKMATVQVRAITGQEKTTLFPTLEDYVRALRELEGPDYISKQGPLIQYQYDYVLMDNYEVAVGGAPDNGQSCPGDSGGPLIVNENGKLTIYGVDSTGNHGEKVACQNFGAIYATFGPAAQDLLQSVLNDPCANLSPIGCEGEVAVRCSKKDEGPRRVLRTDCAQLGQSCHAGDCYDQ